MSRIKNCGIEFKESLELKASIKNGAPITQEMITSTQNNALNFPQVKKRMQHELDIAPKNGTAKDMEVYFKAKSSMERCDNAHRQVWRIIKEVKLKNPTLSTEEPTNVAKEVTPPRTPSPMSKLFMPPKPPSFKAPAAPAPPLPPPTSTTSTHQNGEGAEDVRSSFPPVTPDKPSAQRNSVSTPAAGLAKLGMFAPSPPSTPPGSPTKKQKSTVEDERPTETGPKSPRS